MKDKAARRRFLRVTVGIALPSQHGMQSLRQREALSMRDHPIEPRGRRRRIGIIDFNRSVEIRDQDRVKRQPGR